MSCSQRSPRGPVHVLQRRFYAISSNMSAHMPSELSDVATGIYVLGRCSGKQEYHEHSTLCWLSDTGKVHPLKSSMYCACGVTFDPRADPRKARAQPIHVLLSLFDGRCRRPAWLCAPCPVGWLSCFNGNMLHPVGGSAGCWDDTNIVPLSLSGWVLDELNPTWKL